VIKSGHTPETNYFVNLSSVKIEKNPDKEIFLGLGRTTLSMSNLSTVGVPSLRPRDFAKHRRESSFVLTLNPPLGAARSLPERLEDQARFGGAASKSKPSSKSMTTTHAQTVKNTVWHRQERVSIARLHALGSSVSLPGTRKELSPSLKASVNRLTRPKSIEVFEFEEHGTPPLALRRNSASDFTFPSASDMSQYMAAIAALPETGSKHR